MRHKSLRTKKKNHYYCYYFLQKQTPPPSNPTNCLRLQAGKGRGKRKQKGKICLGNPQRYLWKFYIKAYVTTRGRTVLHKGLVSTCPVSSIQKKLQFASSSKLLPLLSFQHFSPPKPCWHHDHMGHHFPATLHPQSRCCPRPQRASSLQLEWHYRLVLSCRSSVCKHRVLLLMHSPLTGTQATTITSSIIGDPAGCNRAHFEAMLRQAYPCTWSSSTLKMGF